MRGRVKAVSVALFDVRFTPACAGPGCRHRPNRTGCAVHPRVCGAGRTHRPGAGGSCGSSPRVRGRVHQHTRPKLRQRFIPACAGQGSRSLAGWTTFSVHPRVCGAGGRPRRTPSSSHGSPPRMRGRGTGNLVDMGTLRFTPACAGPGCLGLPHGLRYSVHPRVCGAGTNLPLPTEPVTGSPPRVRGRVNQHNRIHACKRFTPACAGPGSGHESIRGIGAVHPRVCGAGPPPSTYPSGYRGSPPRVRGRSRYHQTGAPLEPIHLAPLAVRLFHFGFQGTADAPTKNYGRGASESNPQPNALPRPMPDFNISTNWMGSDISSTPS